MARWLWLFWIYSFFGFLLEKAFAAAVGSERQTRKCFLLLPMCPVYGLGVLVVLIQPPALTGNFWSLALWGGFIVTAVEYAVHFFYEQLLGVMFWDYSGVWGNLKGRVCVPFTLAWCLLLAVVLPPIQNVLMPLLAHIPAVATYGMLLLFTVDAVCSIRLLWYTKDPESLRVGLLLTEG